MELTIHEYTPHDYIYSVYVDRDFLGNPIRNFRKILCPYIFQGLKRLSLGPARFHQGVEIMAGFAGLKPKRVALDVSSNRRIKVTVSILTQPRLTVEDLTGEAQVVGNCSSRCAPSYPARISPVHSWTWERSSR